jgi:hypothetical protein
MHAAPLPLQYIPVIRIGRCPYPLPPTLLLRAARPLFFLCHIYWQAVDMLLGDTATPAAIQTTIRGAQKIESAGCFVYTTGWVECGVHTDHSVCL